jgi:hypothetical protein
MAAPKPGKSTELRPLDWLPWEEAFARIREGWEHLDLAEEELRQALLNSRLISVMVLIPRTGPQEHRFLEPEYWRKVQLVASTDSIRLEDLERLRLRSEKGVPISTYRIFIRRAEFDALHPPAKQPAQVETGPPKRRPGPPTKYDWHTICGEIAARCIDPKTNKLQIPKNQSKLAAEVLQLYKDGGPSLSEMQEAVKRVLAVLRRL